MNEFEQKTIQKTHEEVTAQLGRITKKLAIRALDSGVAVVPTGLGVGSPIPENAIFVDHYDGDDGQTSISHTQVGEEDETYYGLKEVRDHKDDDGSKVPKVEALKISRPIVQDRLDPSFKKAVFIKSHPRTGGKSAFYSQGSNQKIVELTPEQEVIAAARIAGHLRGEVATREIEVKNLVESADEFIRQK